jgi:hypothetical protein
MHWNYRVMKRKNESGEYEFGIYEVYYDDEGKVNTMTTDSMTPVCPSEEALQHELTIMLEAFKKEILDYDVY